MAKTEIDKAFITRGNDPTTKKFTLYSPSFITNKQIGSEQVSNDFGCTGLNLPPKVVWKNHPPETKSFAITLMDKDSETGGGWWHWIVYNIPPVITAINLNGEERDVILPLITVSTNDYGIRSYSGVCPPNNSKHNYVLTVYALNVEKLILPDHPSPSMVVLNIKQHTLGTAQVTAPYTRGQLTPPKPVGSKKSVKPSAKKATNQAQKNDTTKPKPSVTTQNKPQTKTAPPEQNQYVYPAIPSSIKDENEVINRKKIQNTVVRVPSATQTQTKPTVRTTAHESSVIDIIVEDLNEK